MPTAVDTVLSKSLIEKGLLTPETLDPIVMKAAESSGGLASLLVKRGLISEEVVLEILSAQFQLTRIDLAKTVIEKAAIEKVPLKFAEYYHFVPVRLQNRKLTIAVSSPYDVRTQDEIRTHTGCEIQMMLARGEEVSEAIKRYYGLGAGTIEKILQAAPSREASSVEAQPQAEKVEDIEKLAEDASVIKLVNQILLDAFQKRATDIHIEPYRGKLKVRYRIDGILSSTNVAPEITKFIQPVISRIKIMSNLNIIERRLPQDGRAIVKVSSETLDLRVSSIPTPNGESIVIRLLPTSRLFSLEKLGLEANEMKLFEHLIEKPHGVVFITGPTGSGKSTTLYTCLSMINTDERKIITIEDPVEYEIEGITQIQVQPQVGLDFARGLRSILRHDPDVIMVGEVRDLETAEIAARVALTGHLVFSTLHTNDSASGVTRLVDIGVEPYLVASSVEAFIAQRLVRMLCPHCKEEDPSKPRELKAQVARELGLQSEREVRFYRGKGCDKCNGTGFWGRAAIFEVLLVDDAIRELIVKRVPAGQIKKTALLKGMHTLRQSGWRKVMAGFTTPEEIIEATPEETPEGRTASSKEGTQAETFLTASPSRPVAPTSEEKKRPLVEKRLYARLNMKVNIRYRVIQSDVELAKKNLSPDQLSVTKNISAGGLLFTTPESITPGTIVELKIELPDTSQPIECLSRVVRAEEVREEKDYEIAVCFLDLSGLDRSKLVKFVEEEKA